MYYKVKLYRKSIEAKLSEYMGVIIVKKTIFGVQEIMTNSNFYTLKDSSMKEYDIVRKDLYGILSTKVSTEAELNEYVNEFEDSKFYQYYKNKNQEKREKKEKKQQKKLENKKINHKVKEIRGTYKK